MIPNANILPDENQKDLNDDGPYRIYNQSLTINYQQDKNPSEIKKLLYSFFLFVNPTSGGNKASVFTKLDTERIKFFSGVSAATDSKPMANSETEVFIYNLKDADQRKRGFENLKEEQEKGKSTVRIIVGGGDGTVMWVVEEMISHKIDVEKCPLGIVPFGTGNDFSRVLGWGGQAPNKLIGINLDNLKGLVARWKNAITEEFDIWDINIETFENGCFKKIIKKNGKAFKEIMTMKEQNAPMRVMNKRMSNYFSIGIDARIGLGFDRHRSNSAFCNKVVYCWEGIKKMFLRTQKITTVLDSLEVLHEEDLQSHEYSHMEIDLEAEGRKNQVIFDTKSMSQAVNDTAEGNKVPHLKGNPACLLCLNINSYMGGASDVWSESMGKVGVLNNEKEPLKDFGTQKFGDGKLEFLTFASSMSLAQERFFKGRASRVGQGSGPFLMKFRNKEDNQNPVVTYFQLDGEFYQVVAPKFVKIGLSKDLPKGKIKVLLDRSSVNKN